MTLELQKTKPILQMLVDKGQMKPEQQQWVLDGIKNGAVKGEHSGQVAVAAGAVTNEQLEAALHEQAIQKGQAAAKDIKTISERGTQDVPGWLKVNLGNNGVVTPAANPPKDHDGAAAAANIAQNIVIMANKAPQMAAELQTAVESAGALAVYLATPPEKRTQPVELEVLHQWQMEANEGLHKIAKHFEQSESLRNAVLHDNTPEAQPAPKLAQVDAYLMERNKEMNAAISLSSPWQSKMKDRGQQGNGLPPH